MRRVSGLTQRLPGLAGFTRREQWLLVALMLPALIELLDSGMVAVALPRIQSEFGLRVDLLAWVVAAGMLPRVGLMPLYGHLGDRLGRKHLFTLGLWLQLAGAGLALVAPGFAWLVVGRLLQGLGGSSTPLSMALVADAFPSQRRGRALGLWNAAAPAGIIFGPVIGGVLVAWLGWRSIFAVVALGLALALAVIARAIPAGGQVAQRTRFDLGGAVLLVAALVGLLLATTTHSLVPLGTPLNLVFWAVGLGATAGLLRHAWRAPYAFLGRDVLANPYFVVPALAVNLRMVAHDGARFLLALYAADSLQLDPRGVGGLMLFYSVPLLIGVTGGGFLADRWASRLVGTAGMLGLAGGLLWIGLVPPAPLAVAPGMMLAGLAAGSSLVTFSKEAIASLGPNRVGLASGLYNTVRFAGAAAATPLLGLLLDRSLGPQSAPASHAGAYQLGFQILAVIAVLGTALAAVLPGPKEAPAPEALPPEAVPQIDVGEGKA